MLRIHVESQNDLPLDHAPRRFKVGKRSIEVVDVLDQWLGAEYRYFKLRGSDGAVYILRHDIDRWRWELTMYETQGRSGWGSVSSLSTAN